MAEIDLAAIRARAIAAGGRDARWKTRAHPADHGLVTDEAGKTVVYDEGVPSEEQAAHIAGMDPATTLALLDLIES